MHGLTKAGVTLDRKALADIAMKDAALFKELAGKAQAALKAWALANQNRSLEAISATFSLLIMIANNEQLVCCLAGYYPL